MEYMLMGTEILHSSVRRYTSPEEHAFFPDYIPDPIDELAKLQYPDNLLSEENDAASCCLNDALLKRYMDEVIPAVCESGDDEQHGSSVLADVNVLQALSKRIHYGKFVAESKYRSDPEGYQKLVDNNDVDGVMKLLTNAAVEKKVLKRAKMKCATYGREPLVDALAEREGEDEEVRSDQIRSDETSGAERRP
jgi:chorismate mutase